MLRFSFMRIQAVFGKGKMPAQSLHHIGIRFRQLNQQLEQLFLRYAITAKGGRHAHCAKTGLLQPLNWLIGQSAGLFTLQRARCDTLENRADLAATCG